MSQIVPVKITTETTANAITLAVSNSEISEEQQVILKETFSPFFSQAKEWFEKAKELEVTDVSQTDKIKQAKEARLALKKIRLEVEQRRKELKEDSLRTGQAIDKVARVVKNHIKPTEDFLKLQEDFVKIQEDKLHAERLAILKSYEQYVDVSYKNLGKLTEEEFATIHEETKEAFEYTKKQERLAEEKRMADERAKAAEAKRLAKENKKLRAAQRLAEEEALKEKKRAAAEQEAKLEAQRKLEELEREQQEAKAKKLEELQDQLVREQAIAERERLLVEKEQELELEETVEKDWSNDTDKEKLQNILNVLNTVSVNNLETQTAQSLWKKTNIQINAAIKTLERGINKL